MIMNKRITFRHMDHSNDMEKYINDQLSKIERFLENEPTPIYIDFVLEASKVHAHPRTELRIKTPHYNLVSHYEHEGADMQGATDHVIDAMYHTLREEKNKRIDQRKMSGRQDNFKKQR